MIAMNVTEKLQLLVAARGISQSELARRAGFTQPRVYAWLNGKGRLYADQAWQLARALEVPLDFLMDPDTTIVPAAPGEREKQVREIAQWKGWEWVYRRLIDAGGGGSVPGFEPRSPSFEEEEEARRQMAEQIKRKRKGRGA